MRKKHYKELPKFVKEANKQTLLSIDHFIDQAYLHQKNMLAFSEAILNREKFSFKTPLSMPINDYINGGFLMQISSLYTLEELDFIKKMSEDFERIHKGFVLFSLIRKNERGMAAMKLVDEHQYRTGYQRTGIDLAINQTVGEHMRACEYLADLLFFDHPKINQIRAVTRYHDIGESVVGDFTPYCPISKDDKRWIEFLGFKLLTNSENIYFTPLFQQAVDIYGSPKPEHEDVRLMVKDVDLLEMAVHIVSISNNQSIDNRTDLINSFQGF